MRVWIVISYKFLNSPFYQNSQHPGLVQAEVTAWVQAEVTTWVQAEVTTWMQAEVTTRMQAEVTTRMQAEVTTLMLWPVKCFQTQTNIVLGYSQDPKIQKHWDQEHSHLKHVFEFISESDFISYIHFLTHHSFIADILACCRRRHGCRPRWRHGCRPRWRHGCRPRWRHGCRLR